MKRRIPWLFDQSRRLLAPLASLLAFTLFVATHLSACTVYESKGRKFLRQRATPQSKPTTLLCADSAASPAPRPGPQATTITSPWPQTAAWAESSPTESSNTYSIRIWIFSLTQAPERFCTWTYTSEAEMNALLQEHLRASAEWLESDL